ncbi:MAG: hypothetical protein HUK08_00220 [Bacteroidaceae bacterium]|nr:hypothetical protein [Bacteroidaceae bacterium]
MSNTYKINRKQYDAIEKVLREVEQDSTFDIDLDIDDYVSANIVGSLYVSGSFDRDTHYFVETGRMADLEITITIFDEDCSTGQYKLDTEQERKLLKVLEQS